jgi:hypothetical protein
LSPCEKLNMMMMLSLLGVSFGAAPESPSASDRVAVVVSQKARMPNHYSLKVRTERRTPNAEPPLETEYSSILQIWRDGNKVRVDHTEGRYTPPRPTYDSRDRLITCENCEREGYGVVTQVLPGAPPALHMVEFKKLGTWSFDYYCAGFDWRYFGLGNIGRCVYPRAHVSADFTKFFGQSGVTTKFDKRGGVPCLLATRKLALNNSQWYVWLSESDEYNPIFFEQKFDVDGVPENRTTEIEWQRTAGGHLFPKRLKHNTIIGVNGKKMPSEEVTTVLHADFDSPIDSAVFTVAGFGLNEGQVIGYPELEDKDRPRWKNGRVEYPGEAKQPESASAAPMAVAPYPVESNLTLVVGVVAAVLAVGTAVAALVLRRRRSAT